MLLNVTKGNISKLERETPKDQHKIDLNFKNELIYIKQSMSSEVVMSVTPTVVQTTKKCNQCNELKEFVNFHKDKNKKDGYRGLCKDCTLNNQKESVVKRKAEYDTNITAKICSNCKVEKDLTLFSKDNKTVDGYKFTCKECSNKHNKERFKIPEVRERINERHREYRKNPEFVQKERESYKEYYHRPEIKERYENYRNHPDIKEHYQKYRDDPINKDRKVMIAIEYKPIVNERLRKKYDEDLDYRIKQILRARLKKAIKGRKTEKTMEYIGCDIDFLKKWIEFRFEHDMTWDNLGTLWHIDHILPVNAFDFTNETNIRICNHWINLQPLYKKDNLIKHDKIELHYYFNNIINVFRFNKKYNQFLGYQVVNESLQWLKNRIEIW